MSLEFVQSYGGRRMRAYPDQPLLDTADPPTNGDEAQDAEDAPDVDFEVARGDWRPIDIDEEVPGDAEKPCRFVDGSNVHEAIAWLRDPAGYPVPVVMAELGGICISADGRELSREFAVVERAISMALDGYP